MTFQLIGSTCMNKSPLTLTPNYDAWIKDHQFVPVYLMPCLMGLQMTCAYFIKVSTKRDLQNYFRKFKKWDIKVWMENTKQKEAYVDEYWKDGGRQLPWRQPQGSDLSQCLALGRRKTLQVDQDLVHLLLVHFFEVLVPKKNKVENLNYSKYLSEWLIMS